MWCLQDVFFRWQREAVLDLEKGFCECFLKGLDLGNRMRGSGWQQCERVFDHHQPNVFLCFLARLGETPHGGAYGPQGVYGRGTQIVIDQ